MILWTLLTETHLAWQSSSLLTAVAVSLRQRELETSGSSFGGAKSQKWKMRDAAAECHDVTELQSRRNQTSSCLSCIHGDPRTAGAGMLGSVTLCRHHADTGDRKIKLSWQGGPCRGQCLALPEVTGHCETAEPRQSHTLTWWKWPNTANSSAPALCNLLIPLTNNSPLSLDGETTAVSARAEPRPLCAHGCFFPGDSQFLALVALG